MSNVEAISEAQGQQSPLHRQKISDGVGPLYHRIYSVTVQAPWDKAVQAMEQLQKNINDFSPQIICRFEKTCGLSTQLQVGDEFQIHITGPWNGPVRVKDVSKTAFSFTTLEGHMEAGQINFRIKSLPENQILFEIESLARSRDHIVDFVYDKVPIAKFAQTEMWKSFCERFAEEIDAGQKCDVQVKTERRDEKSGKWEVL